MTLISLRFAARGLERRAKNEVCQLCSVGSWESLAGWHLPCSVFSGWPQILPKKPTLWMMLQMQLDWGGHAERPDLSPSYSSGARRLVRAGGKVLWSGEGATLTTRGASCVPPPVPALQQREFLLNEVCSVAKIAGTRPQAAKQRG